MSIILFTEHPSHPHVKSIYNNVNSEFQDKLKPYQTKSSGAEIIKLSYAAD